MYIIHTFLLTRFLLTIDKFISSIYNIVFNHREDGKNMCVTDEAFELDSKINGNVTYLYRQTIFP